MLSPLFDVLKAVKEAESKAQDIIRNAKDEVEAIIKKAEADSIKAYDATLDDMIREAETHAERTRQEARKMAQQEADLVMKRVGEEIKTVQARAEKNFEGAVQLVIQEVLAIIKDKG